MKPVVQTMSGQAAAWIYEKPTRGGKMQLLTIGCVSVTGDWKGELGEMFLAWSPLLKRDKQKEAAILANRKPRVIHVKPVEPPKPHCTHGEEICSYRCAGQARGHCVGVKLTETTQLWAIEVHHYLYRDGFKTLETHVGHVSVFFATRDKAMAWAIKEYPTAVKITVELL